MVDALISIACHSADTLSGPLGEASISVHALDLGKPKSPRLILLSETSPQELDHLAAVRP
jgi:hypothetical protein